MQTVGVAHGYHPPVAPRRLKMAKLQGLSQRDNRWRLAIFAHAQKSRSDGTMVARGFSPWTQCEFRVRRGATPESIACNSS
jgi:hypothetical protein